MYARQKLTDGIGLGWAIVSATFLVSGIAVSTDAATYLWNGAKSVVLFAFAVFVVIILFLFKISMAVSVVDGKKPGTGDAGITAQSGK